MPKISNTVQLITYANSLSPDLKGLKNVLDAYFADIVTGVHILPFHPSSADRGFAPLTHFEVDPDFGDWDDIRAIGNTHDVTCDLIVNHISSQSPLFQDYLKRGRKSPYADYFITPSKFSRRILPHGRHRYPLTSAILRKVERIVNKLRKFDRFFHTNGASSSALRRIYRPRAGNPFIPFEFASGKERHIWCTFSRDQVDVDVMNPDVRALFEQIISHHARNGIHTLRLDAVGYAIKKRGTDSFNIPETYKFVEWLAQTAHKYRVAILPEVHSHYSEQRRLADTPGVDFVYDSQLPLMVLHTLFTGDTAALTNWIDIRPTNCVTTLDTHDGLPIPDVEDLLTPKELADTIKILRSHGGRDAMRAVSSTSDEKQLYQVDCTYYSALGENDDAYIAARALQFFIPGIPQVYYVGLLAGSNDTELVAKTDVSRDINRHTYNDTEIANDIKRPVVQRLFTLIRLRNTHKAFGGKFSLTQKSPNTLTMHWELNTHFCELTTNCKTHTTTITLSTNNGKEVVEL